MDPDSAQMVSALHTVFPTVLQAVSFLTFVLLYMPCVAAYAAMRREMETVVQTVDEGIITLDACDNVLVFNAAADSTIIMERGLRSRFPRSD